MDTVDTARTLGRIEGKVDMLIEMQSIDAGRIRALEKKVWGGIGTAVVAFAAAMGHKIGLPLAG